MAKSKADATAKAEGAHGTLYWADSATIETPRQFNIEISPHLKPNETPRIMAQTPHEWLSAPQILRGRQNKKQGLTLCR